MCTYDIHVCVCVFGRMNVARLRHAVYKQHMKNKMISVMIKSDKTF